MNKLTLVLPIRTVSEANQREHWAVKFRRKKAQQQIVRLNFHQWRREQLTYLLIPPFTIRLTRIGARKLDTDNLAGSFKHVQDAIAKELKMDDGDERLTWLYEQEPGKRIYQVRIEITKES